ncbi:MAG TPA: BamA/TamA family outer membrane protein, partial [Candidatus Aquabacterium excrementipullorum]|nr:BamA/TamA family outer membrane protein [Candidatus Aquabacterium excrementipullorum]
SLVRRLNRQWALSAGKPFLQSAWSTAKNATLATLRAEGYAAAVWSGTAATVDAEAQTAKLFVVADSGPRFFYGPLQIEGLKRQPESAIRNTAGFREGEPYSEAELLDFQERLQKLNLFDSVFVSLDDDPAQAKDAPVTVKVRELPLQQATFGIGISSDTGPRISVEHLHRLLWGHAWQAKSKVQLGRDESIVQTDLTSHPNEGRKRWLLSLQGSRQLDTDDARTLSYRARFGQSDEGDRLERLTYAEFVRAKVTSSDGVDVSDASALSANQQLTWRDVDSQILPTRGFTANVQGAVGRTFSTMEEAGWFSRAYGRLTWYRPLPSSWYATVRAEGGRVFAADDVSVPDTLLFRAGGDESVRGYGYRTLGVQKDGVTVGARTMVTSSLELAHPLLQRFPSLWGAVFVDAGDAADHWSDLDMKLGYGAGVRWRSPVGPLRLDLAYGREVREYRIHFSVGITL